MRAKFNAIKHGMRAASLLLPGEDPDAFDSRLSAWTADLDPRDDVERFLVRRAVELSWQLERADRAVSGRSAEARRREDERLTAAAEAVDALGRRLFWSPLGPLSFYPQHTHDLREHGQISWSQEIEDPDDPARLVIRLEATALGCAWMLDRWAELREALDGGRAWLGADRFRAIRLLGSQPLAASEDGRVRSIYRSCWAIGPQGECAYADVKHELGPVHWERWLDRLARREAGEAAPPDEASARATLLGLIAGEEERLEALLADHLQREGSSPSGESFDASVDGERLRRYQATCDRALLRVLEVLRKRRRDAGRAGSAPRPAAAEHPRTSASDLGVATNEPNPPMTPPSVGIESVPVVAEASATNEPNAATMAGPMAPATNEANAPTEAAIVVPATNEANPPAGSPTRPARPIPAALPILLVLALAVGLWAAVAAGAGPRDGRDPAQIVDSRGVSFAHQPGPMRAPAEARVGGQRSTDMGQPDRLTTSAALR